MANNDITQSIANAVVSAGVGAATTGAYASKVDGVVAKCIDGNLIAFIDLSDTQHDSKIFAFPCMCVIAGNAVFAVVMHYSFIASTNSATKTAVTGSATAEYVCGYDLTVNGHIITKRRFGNPGVSKSTAISEAKAMLNTIYTGITSELGSSSSGSSKSVTTVNNYPSSGSASISPGGILSALFGS